MKSEEDLDLMDLSAKRKVFRVDGNRHFPETQTRYRFTSIEMVHSLNTVHGHYNLTPYMFSQ